MEYLTYRMPSPTAAVQERTLFTVDEFVELPEFNYLSVSALRHLLFRSRPHYSASGEKIPGNGLVEAGAIVRLGRRVMISAPEFRAWTLSQREVIVQP